MDDSTLQIGIQVQLNQLRSGMSEAKAQVTQALKAMADAEVQLGAAAAAGNQSATATLNEYRQAVEKAQVNYASAQIALKQYTQAQRESAASAKSAAAAAREEADAIDAATAATARSVSPTIAATTAMREFDGNITNNTRGAARFLTTTLGLGPALAAAFPIFGAVAFGGILIGIGEKLVKFGEDAASLASELNTDWLNGAVGMLTGLKEEVKQVDDEILRLAEDIDETASHQKTADLENIRLTQGAAAADRAAALDKRNQIASISASLQIQVADQKRLTEAAKETMTVVGNSMYGAATSYEKSTQAALLAQKDLEKTTKEIADHEAQINLLKTEAVNLDLKADQAEKTKPAKTPKGPHDNPDADALNAMKEALAKEKLEHQVSIFEELSYWQQRISTFQAGTAQYREVLNSMVHLEEEAHRKEKQETLHAAAEEAKAREEGAKLAETTATALREYAEDVEQSGKRWDGYNAEVTHGTEIQSKNAASLAEASLGADVATGKVSELGAAQILAAIHTQEHTDKLKALKAELDALKAEGANLQPGQKGYEENRTKQQKATNSISAEEGSGATQKKQDSSKVAAEMAAPYVKAATLITDSFNKGLNSWLTGQKTFANAMRSAWQSVAMGMIQNTEKATQHYLAGLIKQKAATMAAAAEKKAADAASTVSHVASQTAQTAATTVGTASQTAVTVAGAEVSQTATQKTAVKSIFAHAKSAAGGAYDAMAGIPVIGPVLGAIAAAATFSGVMALAAFEQGTDYVPRTGMAVLHQGEAVLNGPQNSMITKAIVNMSKNSGNGGMTVHNGGNTFQAGMDKAHFAKMLGQHERNLTSATKKALRSGKLR